jgi:hypothetical protein
MYQCLKQLCDSGSDAHEEEVESLCKLLTTVGADIDRNPQTATWIDFFFKRMKSEMYNSPKLSSRVKFMILVREKEKGWADKLNRFSFIGCV